MSFDQFSFDSRIAVGIKAAGYITPTPIQAQAIPIVLQGRDVLGLAQTGTGKTAAFMLPILQRLLNGPSRRIRVLILAPTRELAEQIHQATAAFGQKTGVRSVAIYGGVGKQPQADAIRKGVEIVIACPGRLLDLIQERRVDLSHVEVLVLDEADRMCDMGFLPDVRRVLKYVPAQRQTLFFSATMPPDIRSLAATILKQPVTIQIGELAPVKTVSHALYPVADGLKTQLTLAMLNELEMQRVLIFTRTKSRARRLALNLEKEGYRVSALQGNMSQSKRQQAIDGFRSGTYDILVATDLASRGIDVAEISHVINFDMPDTADAYTHRIGRTGRAELTGEAYTFMKPDDEGLVRDIEKVLGRQIERRWLPGFDYNAPIPIKQPQPTRPRPANQVAGQTRKRQPAPQPVQAQAQAKSEGSAARRRRRRRRAAARRATSQAN